MRFLHAADIHLDSPLRRLALHDEAPAAEIRHATRRAFENLIDRALAASADFLLIAGDLYDGDWQDYNTGLYFIAQMRRLREADIPVYIAAGNHDAASRITKVLRLPDNVHLFPSDAPATFRVPGTEAAVHGQSFGAPAVKQDLSAGYPPPLAGCWNIGLLHTSVSGREGHAPYAPCTLEGLLHKGYDYWALGHVHKKETLNEDPPVVFPGNLQGRHIREPGEKGCIQVDVEADGGCSWRFQPLDVLRWEEVRVDAAGADEPYEVVDRFAEDIRKGLRRHRQMPMAVRAVVEGACRAHDRLLSRSERWENEIRAAALDAGGGRVWVEKVLFRTEAPSRKGTGAAPDAAVGELEALLAALDADPEALEELGRDLRDLEKKLPPELREDAERAPMDDPEHLRGLLGRIRPMLLERLGAKGGDP